jgi:hypothetical protein
MATLEAKRRDLLANLEAAPPPTPRLHPNQQKVINLAEALNDEPTRLEATECLRELIEEIRLVPDNGKLRIELYGELASLIKPCKRQPPLQRNGGASNAGCGDSQPS